MKFLLQFIIFVGDIDDKTKIMAQQVDNGRALWMEEFPDDSIQKQQVLCNMNNF